MYGSKDPTCPFFSVYSLTDVLDTANPDALVVSTAICSGLSYMCVQTWKIWDLETLDPEEHFP